MMLDSKLLEKVSKKTKKPLKYVREQVSKRASRAGVTSPAALVIWARELKISTVLAFRNLAPHIQEQVREVQPSTSISRPSESRRVAGKRALIAKSADPIASAIDRLLTDEQLRNRCKDLLTRPRYFDRVFREATTVLESRIRRISGISGRPNPEALVNTVLNPDPAKAILVVSEEPNEQAGIHSICRGVVLAFRHKSHHELDDKVGRDDAVKFCSFIDVLLTILANAKKKSGARVAP